MPFGLRTRAISRMTISGCRTCSSTCVLTIVSNVPSGNGSTMLSEKKSARVEPPYEPSIVTGQSVP